MKLEAVKVVEGDTKLEHVHWQQVAENVVLVSIEFASKRPRHIASGEQSIGVVHEGVADDADMTWIEFHTDQPCSMVCDGWDKWTLQVALLDRRNTDPNDLTRIPHERIEPAAMRF